MARFREVTESANLSQLSELEREGVIQRFEYTNELAWKTLQNYLRLRGYTDIAGPNSVLMQSFQDDYIADNEGWRQMKKARELASHTYDSDTAEEIVRAIFSVYFNLLDLLEKRFLPDYTGG